MKLTSEQIEMLRKGYRRAQELPEGFAMETWAKLDSKAPCGTVCCFAGELLIANGKYSPQEIAGSSWLVAREAVALIGIEEVFRLFSVANWPDEVATGYYRSTTRREQADCLAEAVERFITEHS